jgi:hypothetical protein
VIPDPASLAGSTPSEGLDRRGDITEAGRSPACLPAGGSRDPRASCARRRPVSPLRDGGFESPPPPLGVNCATSTAVTAERFSGPGHGVDRTNARRMWSNPELQVLRAVVIANSVEMVNPFTSGEVPPEHCLHHQDVLKYVSTRPGGPWVIRHAPHHVSSLVFSPSALPVAVGLATLRSARPTRSRLELLCLSARTEVLGSAGWATEMSARRDVGPAAVDACSLCTDGHTFP